ncbi:hypothetical protein TNCV_3637831 [Trichonephila clavipes]|nr:hypothetical protein TNCV_3637831 [Trichonephila clavipes]
MNRGPLAQTVDDLRKAVDVVWQRLFQATINGLIDRMLAGLSHIKLIGLLSKKMLMALYGGKMVISTRRPTCSTNANSSIGDRFISHGYGHCDLPTALRLTFGTRLFRCSEHLEIATEKKHYPSRKQVVCLKEKQRPAKRLGSNGEDEVEFCSKSTEDCENCRQ